MNKRYFYTDPLAAAWMAFRHDIRFTHDSYFGEYDTDDDGCTKIRIFHDQGSPGRFYIRPETLHLLVPQEGDVAYVREIPGEPLSRALVYPIHILNTKHDVVRIISRNGIAFMWPESEEE